VIEQHQGFVRFQSLKQTPVAFERTRNLQLPSLTRRDRPMPKH
jgi:hypothetical protein